MSFCLFKQKTAYDVRISDWSSDVCSSDLLRLACRLACRRRLDDLLDDAPGLRGMLLEPLAELGVDHGFDGGPDLRGNQLVLGLAGEFRVRHLDRQDAGQALAGVVAGDRDLLPLGDAGIGGVSSAARRGGNEWVGSWRSRWS